MSDPTVKALCDLALELTAQATQETNKISPNYGVISGLLGAADAAMQKALKIKKATPDLAAWDRFSLIHMSESEFQAYVEEKQQEIYRQESTDG